MASHVVLSITEQELLSALEASVTQSSGPEEALTTRELMAKHKMTTLQVLAALRVFGRQNRLVTHRVVRLSELGLRRWVPAYTLLPERARRR